MAWWYSAIALAFTLLAIDHVIIRDKLWLVGVRFVIAIGFGLLAVMEFRTKRRKR